jgi:hypothetical protein
MLETIQYAGFVNYPIVSITVVSTARSNLLQREGSGLIGRRRQIKTSFPTVMQFLYE